MMMGEAGPEGEVEWAGEGQNKVAVGPRNS